MPQIANLTIHLQAIGGHFLGANAYDPANIILNLSYSGGSVNIPYIVTTHFTDDGNVSPEFIVGASSFMPIITIPQPAPAAPVTLVNFLSGDFTTVAGRLNFNLPATVEFAELSVSIPTTLDRPFLIKQSVILNPAQTSYQVTIPVPGLYLSQADETGSIAVFVKMMCGCPVTEGPPASLWPANDFTVYANVLDVTGVTTPYLLTYAANQTGNSLFSAALLSNQAKITSVSFTAFQKSTGNYGAVSWTP
jgi:hypothetical protein